MAKLEELTIVIRVEEAELIKALKNWWLEWPDPRIRPHGKFESENLWLKANEYFNKPDE